MSLVKSDKTLQWATGLELCGLYYEGYTDNLQELLNKHSSATITKGVGTGPAGPVLAGPLFSRLAYMVKQNCMFEKSRR